MTNRSKRDALKVQLVETRRMKELAAGHPLMALSFREREKDLWARLEALPLGNKEANEAYDRAAAAHSDTKEIEIRGVFKGVLLKLWRFDFVNEDGHKISGKIDENLTSEQVVELNRAFFNERCVAVLDKMVALFRNGRERTT